MPSVEGAKRRRVSGSRAQGSPSGSRIFAPFRTIGLVTNEVPFAVTSLGQSYMLTTSVGRSFQIYDASTLHLVFVSSPQAPSDITCLHSHFHYVFAAWDHSIGIYKRGRLETTITLEGTNPSEGPVKYMELFGKYLVAATSEAVYVIEVDPKVPSRDPQQYTSFRIPAVLGSVRGLVHLATYLNKIVIATDKSLLVFNVRSGKLLFTSDEFPSQISTIEPVPVLDMIGVGTGSGQVFVYNIRKGRTVLDFSVGDTETVTSLSFRTDGTAHVGVGTSSGSLVFYDLNNKRRAHVVRECHDESTGGVSRIQFLNGQPIVVSSGGDNLLQEMVFDPSVTSSSTTAITSPPRVLRSRGGHARPPTVISFTDEEAHHILSASQDRSLWSFSLRKDAQAFEFSQRTSKNQKSKKSKHSSLRDKMPEITAVAYQADKQNRWDNIVTAHQGQTFARTWSGQRGIVGAHQLPTSDGGTVKSVAISACGNFAIVGSSGGSISIYNLQSGILRKTLAPVHSRAVTGVVVDAINSKVMSCSLDGTFATHDFTTAKLLHSVKLDAPITDMRLKNSLAALVLDNLSIVVIDTETQRVVRELWGHLNRITSFDFSPDGRWIISSSLDSTIRTWDLPSGGCIDVIRVPSVVTCLRISPGGDWLATAHVEGTGVQLWTLKAQFSRISARQVSEDEVNEILMPNAAGEGGSNIIEGAFNEQQDEDAGVYTSKDQLSDQIISLSLQPRAKFQTLKHLEAIKLRNRPKEPPKTPKALPFFLGQDEGKKEAAKEESQAEGDGQKSRLRPTEFESKFTRLLREREYSEIIAHLRTLSPSATDIEIRSLDTTPPLEEFVTFIDALTFQLQAKKDYELVQVWMSMLLRVHGDVILEHGHYLESSLRSWESVQRAEAERLDQLVKYCAGVINYLRAV